jgi:hypothetical protein
VSERCLAGCCPHECGDPVSSTVGGGPGCPSDVPGAPWPERAVHLYTCQGLSTYRTAAVVGVGRQRVTRVLHRAGVAVKPRGTGRRRFPRGAGAAIPGALLADLYLRHRLTCAQISGLTQIPPETVRDRLRAGGIRLRTRGRFNREDRLAIDPDVLADLYLQAGLPSGEIAGLLGVSRAVVLRTAHDEGMPVRMGGPPPSHGPTEIELIAALYADPDVRQVLARHGLPTVPPGGPVWQRFPVPVRLSPNLAEELYVSCGVGVRHIELLRPARRLRPQTAARRRGGAAARRRQIPVPAAVASQPGRRIACRPRRYA